MQPEKRPEKRTEGREPPPDVTTLSPNQFERRQRIVETTGRLLAEQRYEQIQMRDVAIASSVALGTVYRYFDSKEHLFGEVLVFWSEGRLKRTPANPPDGNPQELLTAVLEQTMRAFERWPNYVEVVLMLEGTTDVYAKTAYAEFTERSQRLAALALTGVHDDDRYAVVEMSGALTAFVLRRWMLGFISVDEARQILKRSVALIFGQPKSTDT